MKTLSLIFAIGILSLTAKVSAAPQDYIITENEVVYFEKVRVGLVSNFVGIDQNVRARYSNDEVVSYRKDGRVFEKMPVIYNNKETGKYAFMELIAYRNGLKVYRHHNPLSDGNCNLLVYRDGRYVVSFDKCNTPTLNEFFFRSENFIADR